MNKSQRDALGEYITTNIIENEEGLITPAMVRSAFSKELDATSDAVDGIIDFFNEGALIMVESEEDLPRVSVSEDNDPDLNKLYYCELEESFWLYDAEVGDLVKLNVTSPLMVNVKYAELKSMRDNGELKPGCRYRITDYVTKVRKDEESEYEYFRSEEHPFDVIVLALDERTLSENAKAVKHGEDLRHNTSIDYEMEDTQQGATYTGNVSGYTTEETTTINNNEYYIFHTTNNVFEVYQSGSLVYSGNMLFCDDEYDTEGRGRIFYATSIAPQSADDVYMWIDGGFYSFSYIMSMGVQTQPTITITNEDTTYIDTYFDNCNLGAWELKYTLDHPKNYEHSPIDETKILSVRASVCTSWQQDGEYTTGTNTVITFDEQVSNPVSDWGGWESKMIAFQVPSNYTVYGTNDSMPTWKSIVEIDVVLLDRSYEYPMLYGYSYSQDEFYYYIEYDTTNRNYWLEHECDPNDVEIVTIPSKGKGFIKYMKDEHGNACDYDFKNVTYIDPEGNMVMNSFKTLGNVLIETRSSYSISDAQLVTWLPVTKDSMTKGAKGGAKTHHEHTSGESEENVGNNENVTNNEEPTQPTKGGEIVKDGESVKADEVNIRGYYAPYVSGNRVRLVDAETNDIVDYMACDFVVYPKLNLVGNGKTRGAKNERGERTGSGDGQTPQFHNLTKRDVFEHYMSHRHSMMSVNLEQDIDNDGKHQTLGNIFNINTQTTLTKGGDDDVRASEATVKMTRQTNPDTLRYSNGQLVNAGYVDSGDGCCYVTQQGTRGPYEPIEETSRDFNYGYLYVYTYSHYYEGAFDLTVQSQESMDHETTSITNNTLHSFDYYDMDSWPGENMIYLPSTCFLLDDSYNVTIKGNEFGALFADCFISRNVSIEDNIFLGVPWDEDYDDWAYAIEFNSASVMGCMFNQYNLIPNEFYNDYYCIQGEYNYLAHLPELSDVAYSGDYSDLSNLPTIGDGQVTLKDSNNNILGSFTMNQTANTNIEITTSDNVFCTQAEFDEWEQLGELDENKTYFIECELADVAYSGKLSDITPDVEFEINTYANTVTCNTSLADIPNDGCAKLTITDSGSNVVEIRGTYNKVLSVVNVHINNPITGLQLYGFECTTSGSVETWTYSTTSVVTSVGGYAIQYISAADYALLNPPDSNVIYLIY